MNRRKFLAGSAGLFVAGGAAAPGRSEGRPSGVSDGYKGERYKSIAEAVKAYVELERRSTESLVIRPL